MECRDWKERISAAIDGEASAEEARLVERHVEGCAQCRALQRRMRAVGTGVARVEGSIPPDFREKLFARLEAEELLPRRRSLFAFSLRWAAVPVAAAAALALVLLASPDRGKDAVSLQGQPPRLTQRMPATQRAAPSSGAVSRQPAPPAVASAGGDLSPEDREIIANLDLLEDPSALDEQPDVDAIDLFLPSIRRQG